MIASSLRRHRKPLLRAGRCLGFTVFGFGAGVAATPYLMGYQPPFDWQIAVYAALGLVFFAVSLVAERYIPDEDARPAPTSRST